MPRAVPLPIIAPAADAAILAAILAQIASLHQKLDALSNRLASNLPDSPDAAPAILLRTIYGAVSARALSTIRKSKSVL